MQLVHRFQYADFDAQDCQPDLARLQRRCGDAPDLFAFIDRLGGERITTIALTDQLNAGCATAAGQMVRELRLGWPLLDRLCVAELEAILAHELAHATSLGSRVWRGLAWLVAVLKGLEAAVDRGHRTRIDACHNAVRAFRVAVERRWFRLSRQCEFNADAVAARRVSPEVLATALIRIALLDVVMVRQSNDPSERAMTGAADLVRVLNDPRRVFDTHPTLAERLRALGVSAALPPVVTQSAATLLGPALEGATRAFTEAREISSRRQGLELPPAISSETRDLESSLTAAKALWQRDGAAKAAERLRQIAAEHPESARAQFLLGRALLDGGDDQGVAAIERAIALDATAENSGR